MEDLVGVSRAMCELRAELEYASRSGAKVLVTGESGVGKELVARLIHERSSRRHAPLVTINCAGVPDTLLESELFGHVRGSFTGAYRDKPGLVETARDGTLFLDEIGEMSLRMQAVLLRFLETGEIQRVGADRPAGRVNVRLIAATNRNLMDQIAAKAFREDLYYRLNVIYLNIAPLRERREDIPELLHVFLKHYSNLYKAPQPSVSDEAMARLVAYHWPGNVRELRNFVERLTVRGQTGTVALADLPHDFGRAAAPERIGPVPGPPGMRAETLFERLLHNSDSFWSAVYEPFMSRDLTRDDVRAVIGMGLEQTRGSYKILVQLFNMAPEDYKRFLNFLRKYDCHLPFHRFRTTPPKGASSDMPEAAIQEPRDGAVRNIA